MKTNTIMALDFDIQNKIEDLLEIIQKRPQMCDSPKRVEFKLCALLAAWEALAVCDSQADHWLEIWRRSCRKVHHGKSGFTLADIGKRWQPSADESTKAYNSVLKGLKRVFKAALKLYPGPEPDSVFSSNKPASLVALLIKEAFETGKDFADPEGLESFLLTLIGLYESSFGQEPAQWRSTGLWRQEIQRRRSLGPPATRTLADVTSLEVRLKRAQAVSSKDRTAVLARIASTMRKIVRELQAYLVSQSESDKVTR